MTGQDSHARLVEFLESRAFRPVLRAREGDVPAGKHDELADLRRRTETEIERFRRYPSAEAVVVNFRRDLQSQPARKIHRRLSALGLPTLDDIRDEFDALARNLGVEAKE